MSETKKPSFLTGAALLAATVAITKVIGFIYKIPLYNILGDEGVAHFNVTYGIYNLLLTISTAGIPLAISRLIAESLALSKQRQMQRYYGVGRVAFGLLGLVGAILMYFFAAQLSDFMGDPEAANGVRVLAPAVLFACLIAVDRGYTQGHSYMIPTACSQIMEVISKLVFGLTIALIISRRGGNSANIAAGAIVGVTIGLGLALPVLAVLKKRIDKKTKNSMETVNLSTMSKKATLGRILAITLPITISSSILSIISLIDTKLVLLRLETGAGFAHAEALKLYGVYSKSSPLFGLSAAFVVPVSTSVVPIIAGAMARNNKLEAKAAMESSLKLTNLLALPAAVGLSVLSGPIFQVLYPNSNEKGPLLLAILGIASFFVCAQLITDSILQASGFERIALFTFPICGVIKIAANWIMVGNPAMNIVGAPIGTIICYALIVLFNLIFMKIKLQKPPQISKVFFGPLLCAGVMGVAAYASHALLLKLCGDMRIAMVGAVVIAVVVYGVLVIALRVINAEDMKLVPKGDKIAKILHIR